MTARNFFNIVLKIFGLFFLREIINSVPQLISTLFFLFKPENFAEGLFLFVASCLVLTFYIVLTYQLLFRTNNLVDKLKLDRDFNDIIFTKFFPCQLVNKNSFFQLELKNVLKTPKYILNCSFLI